MKNAISSLLLFLGFAQALPAQYTFYVRNGCGVDDIEMGQSHYVFDPSNEAMQIIKSILDANVLEPNFEIKAGDVENALATVEHGKRYIIYNTSFIDRIKKSAGTDWAAYFVFAHEIGHHLNNDLFDLADTNQSKMQELNADKFAGGMLFRLGAKLDEAQAGVKTICKEAGSKTHPPRRARLEAVAVGWTKAKDKNTSSQSDSPENPKPLTQEPCNSNKGTFCVKNATPKFIYVIWGYNKTLIASGGEECFEEIQAGKFNYRIRKNVNENDPPYDYTEHDSEYQIGIQPCVIVKKTIN